MRPAAAVVLAGLVRSPEEGTGLRQGPAADTAVAEVVTVTVPVADTGAADTEVVAGSPAASAADRHAPPSKPRCY